MMSSPDMASKRWIWEQYDRHVMGDTIDSSQSGGDAAIVRIHGTNKALAICSDCNPHYVAANPFEGGKQAVAEAYRNLSTVGATPIAITDNLNFGNPEKPDTMGVIVKAIEGMAEACRALDFPVVSGNVSLYNETDGVGIPPTPVVGGIGLIEDLDKVAMLRGARAGDVLVSVGGTEAGLGASLYARVILELDGRDAGPAPLIDLDKEKAVAGFVRTAIRAGEVAAAHDISEGGALCAVAELALASNVGASIDDALRDEQEMFSEVQAAYILAVAPEKLSALEARAKAAGIAFGKLGALGGDSLIVKSSEWPDGGHQKRERTLVFMPLATLRAAHEGWLPTYMKGETA